MNARKGGWIYGGPATLFLFLVMLVPLAYVAYTSVTNAGGDFSLASYQRLFSSDLFKRTLGTTFQISILASLCSLALGYPIAPHLARQTPRMRAIYMALVLAAFWTTTLVNNYAFTLLHIT